MGAQKAQVFGVSTDTFFALKAWADQQRLDFPLLSDYNKDVIRSYGVVNPDMIGLKDIAKRAVFVIDQRGHRPPPRSARGRAERAELRHGKSRAGGPLIARRRPVRIMRPKQPRCFRTPCGTRIGPMVEPANGDGS